MAAAADLAYDLGCVVLLKGHETCITNGTDGYLNPPGIPAWPSGQRGRAGGCHYGAAGGGLPPLEAAACGAWLHGAAGDRCAAELGQYGMLPTDMLSALPRLMK